MKQVIALTFLVFAATACKKDKKDDHDDNFTGTIAITAPQEASTIQGGTTFVVTGTISGSSEMHGYHVIIYNQNDQSVVFENLHTDHAASYTISETVTHTLTTATPLRMVVEAETDHDGNMLTKEILFNYAP